MIQQIRHSLDRSPTWVTILAIVLSGTFGFIGIWQTQVASDAQHYRDHEISTARIAVLESVENHGTAHFVALDREVSTLTSLLAEIKGQMDVLRREHEALEAEVRSQKDGHPDK